MGEDIVQQVERLISPIYLVGGSIRDILLGQKPKDYDFTTPLSPDEIEARIRASGKRAFISGKRFGTVGFTLNGNHIEVTTFRTEVYGKTRKPSVSFVGSVTEDLSRRDFTINAIARRGHRTIDPFNGRKDLKLKIIRSVGQPALRFNEDPLRMLRAARFASQLDFEVEARTKRAISKHGHKILNVSKERWMQELDKIMVSHHPETGFNLLAETDLIKYVLPEMRLQVGYDQNSPYHELTLWEHSLATMQRLPPHVALRWAGLLHDVGKPFVRVDKKDRSNYVDHEKIGAEIVYGIGKRLKWSNERLHHVAELVRTHLEDENPIGDADNTSRKRD